MHSRLVPYILALGSGCLLSLGFAPYGQAWAGWVGLIPLILTVLVCPMTWQKTLRCGYLFGWIFFGITFFWLTEVTWAGWFAVVSILAIYPTLWLGLWFFLTKPLPVNFTSTYNLSRAALGSCAWVLTEWLRGWVLTGFPWNFLGVTQVNMVAIIQIADLGGVLLVSWLVMLLNLILALTLVRIYRELKQLQKARSHYDFSLSMLVVALAFGYGAHIIFDRPAPVKQLSYLAIQPDLPQSPWGEGVTLADAVNRMAHLTLSGISGLNKEEPTLIIWPETPVGQPIINDPNFRDFLQFVTETNQQSFMFGTNYFEGENVFNSVMLYESGDAPPQLYRKQHLVIMGEYVPLGNLIPFIRKLVPLGTDYSAGTTAQTLTLHKQEIQLAPLICFEDTVVPVVRRFFKNQHVDLFVNLTNDGWFQRSPQSQQHLNNALFRCIEFRRPMLRVANNGVTALINEKGIVTQLHQDPVTGSTFDQGFMKGTVALHVPKNTIYNRFGDWVVWLSLATLIIFFCVSFQGKKTSLV